MKRYGILNINYSVTSNNLYIAYETDTRELQSYTTKCYSVNQLQLCISEFRSYMSSIGFKE